MIRSVYIIVRTVRAIKWRFMDMLATQYYRCVCASFGKGSQVGWGTWIAHPECVYIGSNVKLDRGIIIGCEVPLSKLVLSDGVQINRDVSLDYSGGIVIGKRTFISEQTIIYSHSHGKDPRSVAVSIGKIIGVDCWIGARCIILDSCRHIGGRVLVGAGSIATKDIEAAGTYGGIPARRLGD